VVHDNWHAVFLLAAEWRDAVTLSAVTPTNSNSICNVFFDVSETVGAPASNAEGQSDVSERNGNHCDIVESCFHTTVVCMFHMLWFCQFGHQLLSLCTWLMPHLLQYSGTNTEEWWDLDARPCEHSLKVGVEETDETHNSSFFQWSFIHCMQVCNRFVTSRHFQALESSMEL